MLYEKIILSLATSLALMGNKAQNTSPYWSLACNSNATASSKLGTTNAINLRLFTNNSERIRINTSGLVGIGTTNPLSKLHVNGFGSFGNRVTTGNAIRALNLADDNAVMRVLRVHATAAPAVELISRTTADGPNIAYWDFYTQPTDASFRIRDRQGGGSGFDRMTISHTNGFVGIGTAAPQRRLHLFGSGEQELGIQSTDAGAHQWTLQSNGTASVPVTFQIIDRSLGASRLAIDNNGNVGIGTTFPGFPLNFPNLVGDKISLWGSSADHYGFGIQGGLLQMHTDINTSDIAFGYGSSNAFTENMRIKGNGTVGIGKSDPGNYKLRVKASFPSQIDLGLESSSFTWGFQTFYPTGPHIGGEPLFVHFNESFRGQFNSSSGEYTFISDERLKNNIKQMGTMLEKITQLKPCTYQYKNDADKQEYNGFIAQEVQKVFPSMVMHTVSPEQKVDVYTLGYSGFGVIAIKGIQELIPVIEEQKKINEEQKAKILALEERLSKLQDILEKVVDKNALHDITSVKVSLKQNEPNPTRGFTTIRYQIPPYEANAKIVITDIKGSIIKTVLLNKGSGHVNLNTGTFASGSYIYSLVVGPKKIDSKKFIVTSK